MTLEEWRRAKEVFDVAWELEPRTRERYLAAACGGEESVRAEVGRMLLELAQNEDFLEEPLLFDAAQLPAGEQAGRLVGRYRLVREIGRGGMGAVYLAVRADEEYDKQVALKLGGPRHAGSGDRPPFPRSSGRSSPISTTPTSPSSSTAARRRMAGPTSSWITSKVVPID